MRNESVAILDVRSYEVTFLIGSKGVNDTFVFSGSRSERYEGFSSEGFFDVKSFQDAVKCSLSSVRKNFGGEINRVAVGVPVGFISVQTKGHTISFPSKRKISAQEIESLFDSGFNELLSCGRCIRRSAMYYSLGDNRKYFTAEELYGASSSTLKGALCYYFINENFYAATTKVLREMGFEEIEFYPSSLAQASYLLPQKVREGYAFLLDVGFLTSSFSVVYGNGIVREESFDGGLGYILVSLMQGLDVDYQTAEEILSSANVSGGNVPKEAVYTAEDGKTYPMRQINDIIKYGLDELCEKVETFFGKYYRNKNETAFAVQPISVTGEGIVGVEGGAEHISHRLNRVTNVLQPELPYYDKPQFSSRIALLDAALSGEGKRGWIHRIFNAFGGKKK